MVTIKHLRKVNDHKQKITISFCKTTAKALVEDRNQLRCKKRALVKAFNIRIKEVKNKNSALKKLCVEENMMLHKSFSGEIKKLDQRNSENNTKLECCKRKLVLLKED